LVIYKVKDNEESKRRYDSLEMKMVKQYLHKRLKQE